MSPIGEIIFIFAGVLNVYIWVIIIQALLSWVNPDPYNPIVQFLHKITSPAYSLVKRYIPTVFNGIDLTPIVIIVGLQIINVLLRTLGASV